MRRILLTLTLVLAGLSLAVPVSAATPEPTIRLVSATIVAEGAAVDFRYTVNCHDQGSFVLNETVTQLVDGERTSANGSQLIACTGRAQDVSLRTWYQFRRAPQPGPATHQLYGSFNLKGGFHQPSLDGAVTLRNGSPRNVISAPDVPMLFFYGNSVDPAADKMTLTAVWKCDSSPAKGTGISVTQVVDGRIAIGHGGFEYECTGEWETTQVVFTGTVSAPSFRAGPISVVSQFGWCGTDENGDNFCTDRYLSDTTTVG